MGYYELISKKTVSYKKNFNLNEIESFYDTCYTYDSYLLLKTEPIELKIKIYIQYMVEFSLILRYLKQELIKYGNDEYFLKMKIPSAHIMAIRQSKSIDNKMKYDLEKFGFTYGWLIPEEYGNEEFYDLGLKLLDKLNNYNVEFTDPSEFILQVAKYYEWRKLIWMRTSFLIKNISEEKILSAINTFDYDSYVNK